MTSIIDLHFLERICPFYMVISSDLKIQHAGKTSLKLIPNLKTETFDDCFKIQRPHIPIITFDY